MQARHRHLAVQAHHGTSARLTVPQGIEESLHPFTNQGHGLPPGAEMRPLQSAGMHHVMQVAGHIHASSAHGDITAKTMPRMPAQPQAHPQDSSGPQHQACRASSATDGRPAASCKPPHMQSCSQGQAVAHQGTSERPHIAFAPVPAEPQGQCSSLPNSQGSWSQRSAPSRSQQLRSQARTVQLSAISAGPPPRSHSAISCPAALAPSSQISTHSWPGNKGTDTRMSQQAPHASLQGSVASCVRHSCSQPCSWHASGQLCSAAQLQGSWRKRRRSDAATACAPAVGHVQQQRAASAPAPPAALQSASPHGASVARAGAGTRSHGIVQMQAAQAQAEARPRSYCAHRT